MDICTLPDPGESLLGMKVSYPVPRAVRLCVSGELDTLTGPALARRASTLLTERPDMITANGGQLHLVTGGHRIVTRAITITGLDRVLRLHPDLDTALGALPSAP